jgi:hypothetical protein
MSFISYGVISVYFASFWFIIFYYYFFFHYFIIIFIILYSYQNVEDKFTQIGKAVVDAPM